MLMRHLTLVCAVICVATACSTGPTSTTHPSAPDTSASASPARGAAVVSGGCGSTSVLMGGIPAWLDEAGAHNNPIGSPYAISNPEVAAGFLFGYPLRSGHPENPTNKILWVVRFTNNDYLAITAHPAGAASPSIRAQASPASPGQIYPSIVDVPSPGCWHVDLAWSGHHASVELQYQ
jgi:hypothetical protein